MKTRFLLVILLVLTTSACSTSKWPQMPDKSRKRSETAQQPKQTEALDNQQPTPSPPTEQVRKPDIPAPVVGPDKPGRLPVAVAEPAGMTTPPGAATEPTGTTTPGGGTETPQTKPSPAVSSGAGPGASSLLLPGVNSSPTSAPASQPTQPRRSLKDALQALAGAKPELSVTIGPTGEPVLQIRYPWYELPRSSVQMAWSDGKSDPAALEPMAFDGAVVESKWQEQVDRINRPRYPDSSELLKTSRDSVERKDGSPIALSAQENSLGKTSAYALDATSGNSLVFYLLTGWADEARTLKFALGDLRLATKLAKPGKVRVWLLGEEQPVWSETVDWPGKQGTASVAAQPTTPAQGSQGTMPASEKSAADSNPSGTPSANSTPEPSPAPSPFPTDRSAQAQPAGSAAPGPGASTTSTQPPPTSQASAEPPKGTSQAAPRGDEPVAQPGPAGQPTLEQMNIRQLVESIEKQYKPVMSPEVRKFWLHGVNEYYRGKNPMNVRRATFMSMLDNAYGLKPPKELQRAFRVLFFKLEAEQKVGVN